MVNNEELWYLNVKNKSYNICKSDIRYNTLHVPIINKRLYLFNIGNKVSAKYHLKSQTKHANSITL